MRAGRVVGTRRRGAVAPAAQRSASSSCSVRSPPACSTTCSRSTSSAAASKGGLLRLAGDVTTPMTNMRHRGRPDRGLRAAASRASECRAASPRCRSSSPAFGARARDARARSPPRSRAAPSSSPATRSTAPATSCCTRRCPRTTSGRPRSCSTSVPTSSATSGRRAARRFDRVRDGGSADRLARRDRRHRRDRARDSRSACAATTRRARGQPGGAAPMPEVGAPQKGSPDPVADRQAAVDRRRCRRGDYLAHRVPRRLTATEARQCRRHDHRAAVPGAGAVRPRSPPSCRTEAAALAIGLVARDDVGRRGGRGAAQRSPPGARGRWSTRARPTREVIVRRRSRRCLLAGPRSRRGGCGAGSSIRRSRSGIGCGAVTGRSSPVSGISRR